MNVAIIKRHPVQEGISRVRHDLTTDIEKNSELHLVVALAPSKTIPDPKTPASIRLAKGIADNTSNMTVYNWSM
jgi:hypothetical protein